MTPQPSESQPSQPHASGDAVARRLADELAGAKAELASAREDLAAMSQRLLELEEQASSAQDAQRQLASREQHSRQAREEAQHDRLLRWARPFRRFPLVERSARRARAALKRSGR